MLKTDLQDLPDRWAAKLKKKPEVRRGRKKFAIGPGTTPWGRVRLDVLAEEVSGATVGTRNHTLNKAAFLAGQAVASGHITEDDAHAVLYDAAIAAGLKEREVAKTLGSGLRSGAKHPTGPIIEHDSKVSSRLAGDQAEEDGGGTKPTHLLVPGEPWAAIDAGSRWLASHPDVYSQQGRLVIVYTLDVDMAVRTATAPAGISMMTDLVPARAWDCVSQIGEYQKIKKKGEEYVTYSVDPPMQIVTAILVRASWPGSRELAGISSAPLVHRDGGVCDTRGYDKETGMFFAKRGEVEMPREPSKQDAIDAANILIDAVDDFPWRASGDRAGWLAALVTVATRHLYPTVPLFVVDASTPGSGKTLLTSVISTIALGGPPAVAPFTRDDEEIRKMTFALLLSAVPMVVIDNAPGGAAIGTPALDMLLTSPTKTERVLGESRQATVPNNTTWFYTGNNVSIRGDTGRRAIHIRLETDEERPELRTGFRHPRLLEWVAKRRPALLGATLTIVAAYLRAGRPDVGVTPIGSFETWSELVASSLVWAGQPDPCRLLAASSSEVDPQVAAHIAILEALERYDEPMSARQMIDRCETDDDLRCAILDLCPQRGDALPTTVTLGLRLRGIKDRIKSTPSGRRSLKATQNRKKKLLYSVIEQSAGGMPGVAGGSISEPPAGKAVSYSGSTPDAGGAGGISNSPRVKKHYQSDRFGSGRSENPRQPPAPPAEDIMQEVCQEERLGGEKQQEFFPGIDPAEFDR